MNMKTVVDRLIDNSYIDSNIRSFDNNWRDNNSYFDKKKFAKFIVHEIVRLSKYKQNLTHAEVEKHLGLR